MIPVRVVCEQTNLGLLEPGLNFSNDPLESFSGQLVLLGHPAGTEGRAQEDVEEEGGILLGLQREWIVSFDDD